MTIVTLISSIVYDKIYQMKNRYSNEYVINDFLKLRLVRNETVIYVKKQPFMHCKSLVMNVPIKDLEDYDSIDEADTSLSNEEMKLAAEEEFRGHCSNLQVWYEWNYDTNLLHRNLAFPLLKQLSKAGDPTAREVFVKEIIERYMSGQHSVMEFLTIEGYLYFVADHQVEPLLDKIHTAEEINRLINLTKGHNLLIKAYKKLIEVDPINKSALFILSNLYYETREYKKALRVLESILEMYPDNIDAILKMGNIYNLLLNYLKAIEFYNYVIEMDPMSLEAWQGLVFAYKALKKRTESKTAVKRLKTLKIEIKNKNKMI